MYSDKKELRQHIKTLKKEFSDREQTKQTIAIHTSLEESDAFINARHVLFYWAMSDEVATEQIINNWHTHKAIYLPVIDGDNLKIVQYTGNDCLVPGDKYGIPEPNGPTLANEDLIDLVIVPGVAFDSNNNRMGRGAGYYDRILKRLPQAKKIAFAFDFQIIDQVPVEPHDIKMDLVISANLTAI